MQYIQRNIHSNVRKTLSNALYRRMTSTPLSFVGTRPQRSLKLRQYSTRSVLSKTNHTTSSINQYKSIFSFSNSPIRLPSSITLSGPTRIFTKQFNTSRCRKHINSTISRHKPSHMVTLWKRQLAYFSRFNAIKYNMGRPKPSSFGGRLKYHFRTFFARIWHYFIRLFSAGIIIGGIGMSACAYAYLYPDKVMHFYASIRGLEDVHRFVGDEHLFRYFHPLIDPAYPPERLYKEYQTDILKKLWWIYNQILFITDNLDDINAGLSKNKEEVIKILDRAAYKIWAVKGHYDKLQSSDIDFGFTDEEYDAQIDVPFLEAIKYSLVPLYLEATDININKIKDNGEKNDILEDIKEIAYDVEDIMDAIEFTYLIAYGDASLTYQYIPPDGYESSDMGIVYDRSLMSEEERQKRHEQLLEIIRQEELESGLIEPSPDDNQIHQLESIPDTAKIGDMQEEFWAQRAREAEKIHLQETRRISKAAAELHSRIDTSKQDAHQSAQLAEEERLRQPYKPK